jgi:Ala-tRNA(Pro) deacylase
MPVSKVKEHLDANGVRYSTISHSVAYTAQEIASIAHIPGKDLAKVVVVRVDGEMAMAVLPASFQVDLKALEAAIGAREVRLATETEFKYSFPDCEPGAMPPFGNLYGMKVYVDETLTRDREIVFNAGTHRDLVRLGYDDFARLVKPQIFRFSTVKGTAAA